MAVTIGSLQVLSVGTARTSFEPLSSPSLTVVTCVESGHLEAMTVRMFDSVRRFGGALGESSLTAVIARTSPPLTDATRRRFRDLEVSCIRATPQPRYGWYHFMNKPVALLAAEKASRDDVIVFLDADTLVLRPPNELSLSTDTDMVGCPSDNGVVGSTGPGSPYDPEWRRIANANGVDLDELPWVRPYAGGPNIRFYLNGGVIGYRRGSGYASAYLSACERALDARAGFARDGEHWVEQVCIGVAAVAAKLRWRLLSQSHNYAMASYLPERYNRTDFQDACIVHYHDSMGPAFWPTWLERIRENHPHAYEWLESAGPLRTVTPLVWRVANEFLRVRRGVPRRRYRNAMRALR